MIRKYKFNRILIILIFICLLSPTLFAVEKHRSGFAYNHFVGGRFGAWVMTANEDFQDSLTDFSSSTLYAEFFYAHRISPLLAAEFSVGLFSQGDMQYDSDQGVIIGEVKLYPVFISGKLYPISGVNSSFYPYLRLGGGLIYGTRDISTVYYNDPANYYIEESQTKLTYMWGGGIDWAIADQIGLNLDFKYTPVKFGGALAGLKDYSGWNLTFGVGYILESKKRMDK